MSNTKLDADNGLVGKLWLWIDEVIIGEQFCPFAKVPREKDTIHLIVSDNKDPKALLETLALACQQLDQDKSIETTLVACSQALSNFDEYLDVLDAANTMLEDIGYYGIYQLASFHPQYCFAGEAPSSVSNYTNRSPVPMFHLIREASITLALQFVDDPQSIPERNIAHAHKLGVDFFKRYLSK